MDVSKIANALGAATRSGHGWTARCPAHDDQHPSLSLNVKKGKLLVHCLAGCSQEAVIAAMQNCNLWPISPPSASARNDALRGCTLEQYATAKSLPIEYLKDELHLADTRVKGRPAVEIPYCDMHGAVIAVRYRTALEGPDRFSWRKGDKPVLYGQERLREAASTNRFIIVVEGESDAQTLWHHGVPAVGLPGASLWNEKTHAETLSPFETVYVVIEPDQGGRALALKLLTSQLAPKIKVIELGAYDDVSGLYLAEPDSFVDRWRKFIQGAMPLLEKYEKRQRREREIARRGICPELAVSEDILGEFAEELERHGVVGVAEHAKLLYLAMISRLLNRPVSVAVKGPSSGGKSFLVDSVLRFFPPEAFLTFSSMSERVLIYSREPLAHRMLVMYEAAGMASDFAAYLIRTLLSEGRLVYEVVVGDGGGGFETERIEREGPTGLIVTTTAVRLHAENETRLISITITDTQEQTEAILAAQADPRSCKMPNTEPWHALQKWLALGPTDVEIPFGPILADEMKGVSVRLRRDFPAVLALVKSRAILHQEQREIKRGIIIAEIEDYAAVYRLIASYVQEGVEATVTADVREVVTAVHDLADRHHGVSLPPLATRMRIDKSSAGRRAAKAASLGYIKNLEDRRGQPARYVLGNPMPETFEVLPSPERLRERIATSRRNSRET